MDSETAQRLNALTSSFYRQVSASFSETRQQAWDGWSRVLETCRDVCRPGMSVLDLGCGNLRFERFLIEQGCTPADVWAVDNCDELVSLGPDPCGRANVHFQHLDITRAALEDDSCDGFSGACDGFPSAHSGFLGAHDARSDHSNIRNVCNGSPSAHDARNHHLGAHNSSQSAFCDTQTENTLARAINANPCDLSVSFGLMHHLPTEQARMRTLEALVRHTRAQGYVAVSFWQFAHSEKLRAKARKATECGLSEIGISASQLGEDDYLMGWQKTQGTYRFCHHCSEADVDRTVAFVSPLASEIARFSADGKQGNLNRYVVLKVR